LKIKHFFLASLILVFTSCEQYNSSIRDFTDGESESLNSIGIFTVSSYEQVYGNYWSATATRYSGSAMQFDFGSAGVSSCNRTYGRSVRLVKDL
jgi:hypothetical protein